MPNLQILAEEQLLFEKRSWPGRAIEPIRRMLCGRPGVPVTACQLAAMPVLALADLPLFNVELEIMPAPDRTRDRLSTIALRVRGAVAGVTGTHVACVTTPNPETCLALP